VHNAAQAAAQRYRERMAERENPQHDEARSGEQSYDEDSFFRIIQALNGVAPQQQQVGIYLIFSFG